MLCQTKRSLDNKEWERCSVSETSRLYQLSNPEILCGGVDYDTVVIKQLIDMVFMKYFHLADPRQMIGDSKAFIYQLCFFRNLHSSAAEQGGG